MTSNELYRLDDKGKRQDVTKLPAGVLDGLVALGDSFFVSSWQGGAFSAANSVTSSRWPSPIEGRGRYRLRLQALGLLVPKFLDSAVEVYEVK